MAEINTSAIPEDLKAMFVSQPEMTIESITHEAHSNSTGKLHANHEARLLYAQILRNTNLLFTWKSGKCRCRKRRCSKGESCDE